MRWQVHHGYGKIRIKAQNKAQYDTNCALSYFAFEINVYVDNVRK